MVVWDGAEGRGGISDYVGRDEVRKDDSWWGIGEDRSKDDWAH